MTVYTPLIARLQKQHRERNRVRLVEYLLAHPCVDCGEKDIRVLDFDHRDASVKTAGISRMAVGGHYCWARILQEIEKCDVRCANCHRRRTIGLPEWFTDLAGMKARLEAHGPRGAAESAAVF